MEGDRAEENVETKAIYRINERTRDLVELRRWTVRRDAGTGEESLCIRDCLEEQDIYTGNVRRYDTGDLRNEKYYQFLFWEGLKKFWGDENDSPIQFCNEHLEQIEYEDKQAFLADHGFAFEEVETGVWEPQEESSKLTVYGDDVSKYAFGYKEIYEYTDDGKISSFEARGMDLVDRVPMEVELLSLDYIYRDDGTLYHREYHHYGKFFGSNSQSEDGDYDKQGRLLCQYSYITHGAIDEYYIYKGNHMEPQYRLLLDWGGGGVYVQMIAYDGVD